MKPPRRAERISRRMRWLAAASAGLVFGGGCGDADIQSVVLGGFQSLVIAVIDALFLSLAPEAEAIVTVRAIVDPLAALVC